VQYVRNRKFWALGAYALPAVLIVSLLSLASQIHIVAMAAAFVYGRQAWLRQAFGKSYLFFSVGIFLAAGALVQIFLSGAYQLFLGPLLVAPALVLLFYALRMQLNRLPARKAAGKTRLPNRLAILGLWLAGFVGAGMYSDTAMVYDYSDDIRKIITTPNITKRKRRVRTEGLLAGVMAGYPVWQSVYDDVNGQSTFFEAEEGYFLEIKNDQIIAEFEVTESTQEYVEIYDASRQLTLRIFETEATFRNQGDARWYDLFDGQWISPLTPQEEPVMEDEEETESEEPVGVSPPLDERLQLIGDLFSEEAQARDEARRRLSGSAWVADPELIPALIQYSRDNPDRNEGLWNALYLLERQPDEQLLGHRDAVLDFLDWMAQKGYGPATMERIGALRERL
jgi:hypothetical protein